MISLANKGVKLLRKVEVFGVDSLNKAKGSSLSMEEKIMFPIFHIPIVFHVSLENLEDTPFSKALRKVLAVQTSSLLRSKLKLTDISQTEYK